MTNKIADINNDNEVFKDNVNNRINHLFINKISEVNIQIQKGNEKLIERIC